jgi:hypothetical protein
VHMLSLLIEELSNKKGQRSSFQQSSTLKQGS